MIILHVDTGREMRGGQHQVKLLMTGLRAAGHECRLLARPGSPLALKSAEAGFAVFSSSLRQMWQQSSAANLVHAHDSRAHSMAAVAAQKPFVVSRRVAFPVRASFASRLKYQRAARYLAVSQFVAGKLVLAGVLRERVDVVFDAVEENTTPSAWNPAHPVVAPAFRHAPEKLPELAKEACRVAGTPLVLSDDLPRDLRKASVFVYLTQSEGLGSAALLAMAAGVPVVASRVQGLAEVFEHDHSGLYVRDFGAAACSEDLAREVAACIRRILDEPGLAMRLIQAARSRVGSCFALPILVRRTIESYERVLAG